MSAPPSRGDVNWVTLANGYTGWGHTGERCGDGCCSECGSAGFEYNNGHEWSIDGIRGYRCMSCGVLKPERNATDMAVSFVVEHHQPTGRDR
jgi:hypothetical protein